MFGTVQYRIVYSSSPTAGVLLKLYGELDPAHRGALLVGESCKRVAPESLSALQQRSAQERHNSSLASPKYGVQECRLLIFQNEVRPLKCHRTQTCRHSLEELTSSKRVREAEWEIPVASVLWRSSWFSFSAQSTLTAEVRTAGKTLCSVNDIFSVSTGSTFIYCVKNLTRPVWFPALFTRKRARQV